MEHPKITFVCASYNHERYVKDFIDSLLKQTINCWECFIIDDCSTDNNAKIISSIKDPRIHFIKNKYNRGINYGWFTGLDNTKTDLISMVDSDDMLYPEYVEMVLDVFNKHPNISACYTPLDYMNESGVPMNNGIRLPIDKSAERIFADMFTGVNMLPSPGMAIKKSAIEKYMPLDIGLIQYHDWQFNFLLLFKNKIHMLDKPLVRYRVSNTSACARSKPVIVREKIETKKLMDTVVNLIGNDKNAFMTYFGDNPIVDGQNIDARTIPYWLGRIALTSANYEKQCWGLQTIMDFIADDKNVQLLNKLYGFSFKDYMKFANLVSSDDDKEIMSKNKKIKKYKTVSNILMVLCIILMGVIVCL